MKSEKSELHIEKPESIDPSQPGAFRVQSSYNESDIIIANVGFLQPDTNSDDDESNRVHTFHVQAYRVEPEYSIPLRNADDPSRSDPHGEIALDQNENDHRIGVIESSNTVITSAVSDPPKKLQASVCTLSKIKIFIAIIAILSAVVIIIAVPISLSVSHNNHPRDRPSQIKAIVQSISSSKDLSNTTSPQARALFWLVHNDTLNISASDAEWIRQRYILAVFFLSTRGDSHWLDSFNFMGPTHECLWKNSSRNDSMWVDFYDMNVSLGLSCNSLQKVTTIHLDSNHLYGTIPDEFGYMSSLEHIFMSVNNIWGTIPSTFGMLTMLKTVEIRLTNLTGTFPAFVFRTPYLSNLVLSINRLYGSIPSISHLSSLTNFDFTQNAFTGTVPGLPASITDVDLSENKLRGRLPSSFQSLTRLRTLLLHRNMLTGSIPLRFKAFTNLTYFSVNENMLTGTISSEVWTLPHLTLLGLGGNRFQGNLVGIGASASLQGLSIDNNRLSGTIPTDIGRMTNLYALTIEKNQFKGTLPQEMGLLRNLIFLSLGDNQFSGTIPFSFQNLTHVEYLSIAANQFNGSLNHVCSAISYKKPFIAADCRGGQFCPQGCCKVCCDLGDDNSSTCEDSNKYVDPLYIAYALYERATSNVVW